MTADAHHGAGSVLHRVHVRQERPRADHGAGPHRAHEGQPLGGLHPACRRLTLHPRGQNAAAQLRARE